MVRWLALNVLLSHLLLVENYQRSAKSIESKEEKPAGVNEIRITHSKINTYVEVGLKKLQEEQQKSIVLVGKGSSVNKAVTVVEIIKRKMMGTLHQYTQLGTDEVVEQWDPIEGQPKGLESIQLKKKIPVIIIHLSIDVLPDLESTSGHQVPLGPAAYE
ncbi:hypothetical protein BY458DRAFT_587755 [Sporodiniella umbellata]|nr:hypothetical protein BY458DRAFT_587755 [Sporodiniella umbellata]